MTKSEVSLIENILTVNTKELRNQISHLDNQQLEDLVKGWSQLGQFLEQQVKIRRETSQEEDHDGFSAEWACPIPPEVLRRTLPFLTAREVGRFMVLTSSSMAKVLGVDVVWKAICMKTWPHFSLPGRRRSGYYQRYFQQRQKTVKLTSETLPPLSKPDSLHDKEGGGRWMLVFDIWNPKNELVASKSLDSRASWEKFVAQACLTVDLDDPLIVGTLPRQKCHCWNLPKSYDGWKARLHIFQNESCHALLDTDFSWWKGWSQTGELTFLQRERNHGLELTDRGHSIQHRIRRSNSPQWQGYLGLQFKLILLCNKSKGPEIEGTLTRFEFSQVRIEAIRLHENAYGNIQHSLFRKDTGWEKHGVELLHLLEELD